MEPKHAILHAMQTAAKPLSNGEIEAITGLDKKAIENAMKVLKIAGLIESPKRCYWQPKV